MTELNVNIDHIATLRQARGGLEPSPVRAALEAEKAGASGIVAHLREDRRHICDADIYDLKKAVATKLNMEMAATEEMKKTALSARPEMATLVPEKRRELTTEGGLEVAGRRPVLRRFVRELSGAGIITSLFVEPDFEQITAAAQIGADMVELHTGAFANARSQTQKRQTLEMLQKAAAFASDCGLRVSAGHGLDYENAAAVAKIKAVEELNIGYSIIARAVFCGIGRAVEEMIETVRDAKK